MRWLWPLVVSLAVASAVGPRRIPGGAALQRGRSVRGTEEEEEEAKGVQQYVPEEWPEYPRPIHPAGPQPTEPGVATSPHPDGAVRAGGNATGTPGRPLQMQNPLYPVTESSYGAYAVLLLALVLFAVGIVGNLSVMCIVWHSYHLKSAWNSILASLALWDFLVLFFCLPVVVFHEITKQRLLGDASCRAVPFVEVSVSPAMGRPDGLGGLQAGTLSCFLSPPGWTGDKCGVRSWWLSGPEQALGSSPSLASCL